jgi:hypothetical protein
MCDLIVVILTMYWPPVVILTITGPYSDSGGHSTLRQRETHILPLPKRRFMGKKTSPRLSPGGAGKRNRAQAFAGLEPKVATLMMMMELMVVM